MRTSLAIWQHSDEHIMCIVTEDGSQIQPLIHEWLAKGANRIIVGYQSQAYLIVPLDRSGDHYSRTELAPNHKWSYWTFPSSEV